MFNPSPVVQLFGSGIFASNLVMYPVGSKVVRNGSRVNTSKDARGPLAVAGCTGFPARSTVAGVDKAFPFWTPGKYRKIPRRASAVYTGELMLARCKVR